MIIDSTMGHLVTFRIITEECCHNKIDLFYCFVDFRFFFFDIILRKRLWKRLEEITVPLELRIVVTRLYENVIENLRTIKGGQ